MCLPKPHGLIKEWCQFQVLPCLLRDKLETCCGYIHKTMKSNKRKVIKMSVYLKFMAYFANFGGNNKKSSSDRKTKINFFFLQQRFETLIITLVFFGCFCVSVSSSTQTISIGLSIPYTVLLFDIVGISQGYITRSIRSAYPQSDLPKISAEGLPDVESTASIPPTKHVLKEHDQRQFQPPYIPSLAEACQTFQDRSTCTSEKEVCLLANYSKFQLPNKGAQTVVSIGIY